MNRMTVGLVLSAVITQVAYAKEQQIPQAEVSLQAEIDWLQAEKNATNIEVVSKQKENKESAAGIVSLVTHEDIERYGATNLADVLNRVTSVYMLSTALWMNGVAAMRGDAFTPVNNHTLVLVNGRPVRDGLNGGLNSFVFRDFPIHQIEQIEVIRGPGSVLYGTNAFSAVINIVTKKKQDNKLLVRGRYGSFNTGQIESEFSYKNEQASISGAVRYRNSKGWLFSAIGSDGQQAQFHTDEEDMSASFYGEWQDFTLNGFVAKGSYNDFGGAFTNTNNSMNSNKLFLDIGYKKQLNAHWLSQANLTYNRIDYNQINPGIPGG
jgi:outer membrane cobalamin receptor